MFRKMFEKKFRITYRLDETAKIAIVYVNKSESERSESESKSVDEIIQHFKVNLGYTVMVEEE